VLIKSAARELWLLASLQVADSSLCLRPIVQVLTFQTVSDANLQSMSNTTMRNDVNTGGMM
jgi:hypothetical protein